MYKVKKRGYVIKEIFLNPSIQKGFQISYESKHWKIWRTVISPGTCIYCFSMNGRILSVDDPRLMEIPVHPNCKCYIETVTAISAGTATNAGSDGVDQYVVLHGELPPCYLTQDEAKTLGWKKWLGNLVEILPGRMIGGDVYKNRDKRLPIAEGRVWYEADFDYVSGFRTGCRLLYSNDGLLFVTYHLFTMYN